MWTLSVIVCSEGSPFQKEACLNQGTILVEHSHCLRNGDSCLPGLEVAGWGGGGKEGWEAITLPRMLPLSFLPVAALIILRVFCLLVECELQPVTLWDMCKERGHVAAVRGPLCYVTPPCLSEAPLCPRCHGAARCYWNWTAKSYLKKEVREMMSGLGHVVDSPFGWWAATMLNLTITLGKGVMTWWKEGKVGLRLFINADVNTERIMWMLGRRTLGKCSRCGFDSL